MKHTKKKNCNEIKMLKHKKLKLSQPIAYNINTNK